MVLRTHFFLFFAFALGISGQLSADPVSKGHKTPHGGILEEAEGMHAELLIDKSGQPKLYLYDKSMKPLERGGLQAKLTARGHDGVEHTRDLKASGNSKEGDFFHGEPIKGLTDWEQAVVSLKIKDRWTHIRFSHH